MDIESDPFRFEADIQFETVSIFERDDDSDAFVFCEMTDGGRRDWIVMWQPTISEDAGMEAGLEVLHDLEEIIHGKGLTYSNLQLSGR